MLRLLVDELVDFMVKFKVAELSQPKIFIKPVFVCEPAPVNVKPFHV